MRVEEMSMDAMDREVSMGAAVANYERTFEIFGRAFRYTVQPWTMNGLDGWRVGCNGVLSAWFMSHEHACRWVDLMAGA